MGLGPNIEEETRSWPLGQGPGRWPLASQKTVSAGRKDGFGSKDLFMYLLPFF